MIPPFSTIQLILEGAGAMLAVIGLGGSGAVAIAVLLGKPSQEVGRRGQVGTTLGFLIGIPFAICTVVVLSS